MVVVVVLFYAFINYATHANGYDQASPHSGHLCRNTFIFLESDILCVVAFLSGYIFRGIF